MAINDEALDVIFRAARTHRAWQDKPVSPALLMAIYDLMRWGPTALNSGPARIVFATSPEAKERIRPHLVVKNIGFTLAAPAVAILGYDLDFARHAATLNPHLGEITFTEAAKEGLAFRNSTLQGAYFMMAARALGLDCGPMSGFDNKKVDEEILNGTSWHSNFLCNLGFGDSATLHPRSPRLDFKEACRIL